MLHQPQTIQAPQILLHQHLEIGQCVPQNFQLKQAHSSSNRNCKPIINFKLTLKLFTVIYLPFSFCNKFVNKNARIPLSFTFSASCFSTSILACESDTFEGNCMFFSILKRVGVDPKFVSFTGDISATISLSTSSGCSRKFIIKLLNKNREKYLHILKHTT